MEPLELEVSISVESYDEKPVENYWNCYVAEKLIVSKLSNFNCTKWRIEWRLCKNFTSVSFILSNK